MSRCLACAVVVACVVVWARGGPVAAQGHDDASSELSIAALLEQRVPEELAVEGVMLSRRAVTLQIEQVGTKLLVSLVDRRTGRVAASTKIERLPADRDAAVAIATHVVADMVSEISERTVAPAPGSSAVVEPRERSAGTGSAGVAGTAGTEPSAGTEAPEVIERNSGDRAAAELRFGREKIGFDSEVSVYMVLTPDRHVAGARQRWYPYQGEPKTRLEPPAFYKLVGRDDLVDVYRRRRATMLGLYWGGGALLVGAAAVELASRGTDIGSTARWQTTALVELCGGLLALAAGHLVQRSLQPISDTEAKAIGEQYNQHLRHKLGLPVTARTRRDVRVLPYVGGRDAGLAVSTAF